VQENGAPADFSREHAAFRRELPRLLREHPGKFALVHGDEVVGVFDNPNDAMVEGFQRFDLVRTVIRPIAEPEEPIYMPHVDVNHPSFLPADR
jgi:hypothetical protein